MLCTHRTTREVALQIIKDGFRDGTYHYPTDRLDTGEYIQQEHTGVWLSDCSLDENEGHAGDTTLCIEIPDDVVEQYEWIEKAKGYRQFLVPAVVVNHFGPPTISCEDRYS